MIQTDTRAIGQRDRAVALQQLLVNLAALGSEPPLVAQAPASAVGDASTSRAC